MPEPTATALSPQHCQACGVPIDGPLRRYCTACRVRRQHDQAKQRDQTQRQRLAALYAQQARSLRHKEPAGASTQALVVPGHPAATG
jgi:hypothetical protein